MRMYRLKRQQCPAGLTWFTSAEMHQLQSLVSLQMKQQEGGWQCGTSAVCAGEGELLAHKKMLLVWDTRGNIFYPPLVFWKHWIITWNTFPMEYGFWKPCNHYIGEGVLFKSGAFPCLWCPGSCSVAVSKLHIKFRGWVGLHQQRVCGELWWQLSGHREKLIASQALFWEKLWEAQRREL